MSQIIVAGNVCLDVIPQFPSAASLDPGTLVRVGPALLATGGVSNVGVALHRLGTPAKLIHRVGDDLFGQTLRSMFEKIDPALAAGVRTVAGETSSYSIVISPPGVDRMFIHCPGANDTFGLDDVEATSLQGAQHFHLGYPPIMRALLGDGGEQCAAIFSRAKSAGLTTSLDLCSVDPNSDAGRIDWNAWLRRVLPQVDCFTPSFDELAVALRLEPKLTLDAVRSLAKRCLDMGAVSVLLKAGDQGVYYAAADVEASAACFEVDVISTTGAGDCTIAGFLSARVRGAPLDQQLRQACAVGACSCEAADATSGVTTTAAIQARVDKSWPRIASIFDAMR
jgi:sugar/nucleoside kinase (ribokinase family)